jgi:NitT/TauT family transport system permease protein
VSKSAQSRIKKFLVDASLPLTFLVAVVIVWQVFVTALKLNVAILPPPSGVAVYIVTHISLLLSNVQVTLTEVLLGFGTACIVGISLAIVLSVSRVLNRMVYPLLVLTQVVPKEALAPLMMLWFGIGLVPKVIIAFIIAFFPIVVNTGYGLTAIEPDAIDLFRSLNASSWQIMRFLRFPNALPSIHSGVKLAISFSVIGAIIAEFVGGSAGLGFLIIVSNASANATLLFASIVVLAAIGIALFEVVVLIGNYLIPWHVAR